MLGTCTCLCVLPAQKARRSCQRPKILLARGTVQGRERSAHGCCILQQTNFLFGSCTSVCAPRVPAFMAAALYIPCSILRSNERRNGVPKIKRLWKTDLPSGQFSTTFLQQNYLESLRIFSSVCSPWRAGFFWGRRRSQSPLLSAVLPWHPWHCGLCRP